MSGYKQRAPAVLLTKPGDLTSSSEEYDARWLEHFAELCGASVMAHEGLVRSSPSSLEAVRKGHAGPPSSHLLIVWPKLSTASRREKAPAVMDCQLKCFKLVANPLRNA